ncbi:hypothetical protein Q5P01_024314 [Channa striata]|uniref:Uncharacterized protein n=1 Tax=Channa striata TaxID=64152 RepID=A0AA88IL63_CHASR|nr:hypothetical protein Q5P01_024314 [Channa striata]
MDAGPADTEGKRPPTPPVPGPWTRTHNDYKQRSIFMGGVPDLLFLSTSSTELRMKEKEEEEKRNLLLIMQLFGLNELQFSRLDLTVTPTTEAKHKKQEKNAQPHFIGRQSPRRQHRELTPRVFGVWRRRAELSETRRLHGRGVRAAGARGSGPRPPAELRAHTHLMGPARGG